MTKNNEMSAASVAELPQAELRAIQGGAIEWVAIAIAVGGYIIANWPDIKSGWDSAGNT